MSYRLKAALLMVALAPVTMVITACTCGCGN
jgi:hypothetical protein